MIRMHAYDADYGPYTGHPGDPRTPDDEPDDSPSLDDAIAAATDEILSTACGVADWLGTACFTDAGEMPRNVAKLSPVEIITGRPDLLLAVIMAGDDVQMRRAVHQLRDLAAQQFKAAIWERAGELLIEGDA
ncbi:MAG TPA: hypothetical protein VN755_10570 [Steroidobacteraceae bacterium]|nr:hypothetical protein [Steroidobacteraceae bacterium]